MRYPITRLILLSTVVTISQCKELGAGALLMNRMDTEPSVNRMDHSEGPQFRDGINAEEITDHGNYNRIKLKPRRVQLYGMQVVENE